MTETNLAQQSSTVSQSSSARWRRSQTLSLLISGSLAILAIAYIVLPSIWQWRLADPNRLRAQLAAPVPMESSALAAQLRSIPTPPAGSPPVVLTYHDISDRPGIYTVTPTAFAAQMKLLHEAGYTTITAAELDGWLRGETLPARSVLLTFDDGVAGVWQAADPILARYHQHAMAFIITGFVGGHQGYYMNWPEVKALAASGRWDIESHTHVGHVFVATDQEGHRGPFLTSREYLQGARRLETVGEYRSRIMTDLAMSVAALKRQHLPSPRFFAYPYSAASGNSQLTDILTHSVRSLFHAAMLDNQGGAITGPTDVAAGIVQRTDVTAHVDLSQWVRNIERATPLPPWMSSPLAHPQDWTDANERPVPLPLAHGVAVVDPGPFNWTGMMFAPAQGALWHDYSVSATLGGFRQPGDGTTTGLRVLADTEQQVQLTASSGSYEIRVGKGESQRLLKHGGLPESLSYKVRMVASGNTVGISIDGEHVALVAFPRTQQKAVGGIELTGQREKRDSPVPLIGQLLVSPS